MPDGTNRKADIGSSNEPVITEMPENENVVKLTPSLSFKTNLHPDLLHPQYTISSNKNEYILVEMKNGAEVLGSDFAVSETTFRTSFANNPNFKVKKNPQ